MKIQDILEILGIAALAAVTVWDPFVGLLSYVAFLLGARIYADVRQHRSQRDEKPDG